MVDHAERQAPGDFEPEAEGGIRWSILDFLFILQRYLLELQPDDLGRREICLNTCDRIVAQIEILAEKGDLNVMQDTASCMTSSLVVFLRKVSLLCCRLVPAEDQILPSLATNRKAVVVSYLQRILLAHLRVSGSDDDVATAYVARFVRRVLDSIVMTSRPPSPRNIPSNGSGSDISRPDPYLHHQNGANTGLNAFDSDLWLQLVSWAVPR